MESERHNLERCVEMVLSSAKVWNAAHSISIRMHANIARWSFGGNRLQIKAEVGLMADVEVVLKIVEHVALKPLGILQSLAPKQELLSLLLKDEQIRLMVWLFPLDHDKRRLFGYGASEHADKPAVADVRECFA